MAKEKLYRKICFPYTAVVKVPSLMKHALFPEIQLIPILRFQVMHDYVCFIAPIDYFVE